MPWDLIIKFFSNIITGVFTDAFKTTAVETVIDYEYGIIDHELQYRNKGETYDYLRILDTTNKETEDFN